MSTIAGPYSMFDFASGAGPFINRVQNGANRGAPHTVTGPTDDGNGNAIYQQIVPADLAAPAKWSDYEEWLNYDPLANMYNTRVYLQLSETQYNNDDVTAGVPDGDVLDDNGNVLRRKKWFEWRIDSQTHWKSQSTNTYAVPTTSMGYYVDLATWLLVEAAYPNKNKSQRDWNDIVETLPEDDIIPWPEPETEAAAVAPAAAEAPTPPAPEPSVVRTAIERLKAKARLDEASEAVNGTEEAPDGDYDGE